MKLSKLDSEYLSDKNLERGFLTSCFLGIGTGLLLPALLPVAVTGMVTTQAIYWGRQLTKDKN